MTEMGLLGAQWRKSSYSSANAACVEVAQNLPGIVAVRDSKNPAGPKLIISPADWQTFLAEARGGRTGL